MDVLQPPLLYLGGCCFRVNPGDTVTFSTNQAQGEQELDSSDLYTGSNMEGSDINFQSGSIFDVLSIVVPLQL